MSRVVPWVFFGSVIAHGALFGGISVMRPTPRKAVVRVELASAPKEKPKAKPEPPKPRPDLPDEAKPTAARQAPKPSSKPSAPAKVAAAPANAAPAGGADVPDLGFQAGLGGPGGLAVPTGGGGGAAPAPTTSTSATIAPTKTIAPPPKASCEGETRKAKAIRVPSPAYPESERASGTAGKVRVEIAIDATGAVTDVRVVQALGPAFDAAAVAAARGASFEPALACGQPVPAKFTVGMTFQP
jgi:TonB family protein